MMRIPRRTLIAREGVACAPRVHRRRAAQWIVLLLIGMAQRTFAAEAPNVVIILLDDIGFADTSTFGGLAQTPALDALAAGGLRYLNFNVTGSCSPTRAALLTGRNHHRVGFGTAEVSAPFPGYDFHWKKSTASLAEVLRRHGYRTAAFGKWHNTPQAEISPVGPFDRWPTGLGFEHFYGFMAGVDNQWEPASLFRDTTPVEAPATPEQGYHLTTDITDQAIQWLHTRVSLAAQKPYFLYFATGAVHWPHQAPREWIERYRGHFDRGWDRLREEIFARQKRLGVIPAAAELTPRPQAIPAWGSLSADQKTLYARQMEVYAGFVAHTDHEIGRLLKAVREGPGGENTLILYIVGDNGSDGESGLDGFAPAIGISSVADQSPYLDALGSPRVPMNQYSSGWAWMGNTPFPWWKWVASHLGALRAPLVISWPARIREGGGVRRQFTHVTDVAATVYELTGIRAPSEVEGVKQEPIDGVSFARTLSDPEAPSRHRVQYFEMTGNRAMYEDGWLASARHFVSGVQDRFDPDFSHDRWELYHLDEDFSQARDLAARYPERLRQLQRLFDRQARDNDVYPLGATATGGGRVPALTDGQRHFVYYADTPRLQKRAMPKLDGVSYRVMVQAVIPRSGAQGTLLSYGSREAGLVLYVQDDRLVFESRLPDQTRRRVVSTKALPRGDAVLELEFIQRSVGAPIGLSPGMSTGTARLRINGEAAGEGEVMSAPGAGYAQTLGIGQTFASPVSDAFNRPFKFTGTLTRVDVEVR